MARALKVYGGNLDGRYRVFAACTSLTAFCNLTGVDRGFAGRTGNHDECAAALAVPGVIFATNNGGFGKTRSVGIPMDRRFVRTMVRDAFEREAS
jgi:hypothetical protein